jgi:hypothetical protein
MKGLEVRRKAVFIKAVDVAPYTYELMESFCGGAELLSKILG